MKIKIELKERSYCVFIDELKELKFDNKICVITNQKIAGLHLQNLLSMLKAPEISIICLPDGEEYKNMQSVENVLEQLFIAKLDRKSVIIAFGGGVVSDIAGFVAGIYQRGIEFINIPTTLLAQVDASVGGKTGVNNKFGKNLIGLFNQPSAVYCESKFLQTLGSREISAGMAEVIKMAVMFDKEFFEFLEQNYGYLEKNLPKIIAKCVQIKANVVAKDSKEQGIRAVLNYGHTFAHVIENETKYAKFLHGEAVAIGMNMANELAFLRGLISDCEKEKITSMLRKFNLPLTYKIADLEQFYDGFYLDKKTQNSKIKFILPRGIGNFEICDEVPKNQVLDALEKFSQKQSK